MAVDIAHLRQWIGKSEQAEDLLTAAPLAGFAAMLDRDDPYPQAGEPLPASAHWLYFLPHAQQSDIGADGHPKRGGFLPPVELPRRMWAGSRLEFLQPLQVGDEIRRTSTIKEVSHKQGKSGDLVFCVVRHEISNADGLALVDEHDIVYRAEADPQAPPAKPVPAPTTAAWTRRIVPDPVLLFRYSALTFNGHRIHYDRSYVTDIEGYPGLIVHGPLIATLLMDLCRRQQPTRHLRRFSFRAVSPLFDIAPFSVNGMPTADGRAAHLWAAKEDGSLAMTAEADFV
ncbi:MAG: MaoC family dehydratase N-terminal domain-containing protein [Rhodospirillales bacterium]|nr:MaoC family dehydratase N-terminal domain-containing protein [Rhodospirillales bacterium]